MIEISFDKVLKIFLAVILLLFLSLAAITVYVMWDEPEGNLMPDASESRKYNDERGL